MTGQEIKEKAIALNQKIDSLHSKPLETYYTEMKKEIDVLRAHFHDWLEKNDPGSNLDPTQIKINYNLFQRIRNRISDSEATLSERNIELATSTGKYIFAL